MIGYKHLLTFILVLFVFSACDPVIENPDLLDSITPGQMAVVVNNGSKRVMNCEYLNNFTSGFKGEVIVQGELTTATGFEFLSISYGSNINDIPLMAKTYVTNISTDNISVKSSYGDSSENAVVQIVYENVSAASVIGTFEGKLQSGSGFVNVKGAFWATPGQNNTLVKRKLKSRN